MTNVLTRELRRSARLTTYGSNGRDYLADTIGWTRRKLDTWLTSSTVRPHLRDWFRVCIENDRRHNDAIEWINTGPSGYFHNPTHLEDDLLLMCLGEGVTNAGKLDLTHIDSYAVQGIKTGHWNTQELWARAAWRVVQANADEGKVFEIEVHAAKAYAWVIDLLCLAFHSYAHRGKESVYFALIVGGTYVAQKRWVKEMAAWLEEHGHEDEEIEDIGEEETVVDIEDDDEEMTDVETEVGCETEAEEYVEGKSKGRSDKIVRVEVAMQVDAVQEAGCEGRGESVKKWIEDIDAFTDDDFEEGSESESAGSEAVG